MVDGWELGREEWEKRLQRSVDARYPLSPVAGVQIACKT